MANSVIIFRERKIKIYQKSTDEIINDVSTRYTELFSVITGNNLITRNSNNILNDLERNIINYLS